MGQEINITIDGIAYKRVEAKYPELQCEECDWHDICGNELCKKRHKAIAFCTGCRFLEPSDNYIFKRVDNDTKHKKYKDFVGKLSANIKPMSQCLNFPKEVDTIPVDISKIEDAAIIVALKEESGTKCVVFESDVFNTTIQNNL